MAWKHRRNIKLDYCDAMEDALLGVPWVIGFDGVIWVRTEAGAELSLDLKSGHVSKTCFPIFSLFDPLFMPYMSFYTPVAGPSMKSVQIEEATISSGEFLGDDNKQVDLGGDVDMQVHHSADADKQRLMGDAISEHQKLKKQQERRRKEENKKRKLEMELSRRGLEERRKKSVKIQEPEMIRAERGRSFCQKVTKSLLGRLPLVRSLGVNMLRSPLGVRARVAASKRGRSPSARVEYPPLGKRAKSPVRSPCMSKSQSPTTSPLGGSNKKPVIELQKDLHHREEG